MKKPAKELSGTAIEFQPDADALEKAPVAKGVPITLYTIIAMMLAFLVWAGIAEIDQVVVSSGRLISTEPNIIIQPIETAQIEAINVTVGQSVKKGEVLARLEPTFITADLSQVKEKLKSLNAQIKRLEAEKEGRDLPTQRLAEQDQLQLSLDLEKQSGFRARIKRLNDNIEKSTKSLINAKTEIRIYEKRLDNQIEIEKMTEKLYLKEFQSRRAVLDASEKRLEIERDLLTSRNRAEELAKEIGSLEADKVAFSNEFKLRSLEELVNARRERDTLQEQLSKSDRRSTLIEMTAPADGIVLEVAKKSKGSVIREGETMVSMVPFGGTMLAEIRINATEISFVKKDAEVRVKIDSFPFQKFGLIKGKLIKLSSDSIEAGPSNAKSAPAYYAGIVELTTFDPSLLTPDIELKVGMSLVAEVMTQKRSVLSYITYPIRQVRSEAMNER